MQPLLSDSELSALVSDKATKAETQPFTEAQFFAEVSAMAQVSRAQTILEIESTALATMGDLAAHSYLSEIDRAPSADLVVSFGGLNECKHEDCEVILSAISQKANRHVFFVIRFMGWADSPIEKQFWVSRIAKYFGLDSVETTEHEIMVLARNRGLCGQIIGKGVIESERPSHMKAALKTGFKPLDEMPAHDRTLHIACYGPSIVDTFELMRGQDVLSVSGAHDLLIGHGIAPKWHAECDPRVERAKFGTPDSRVQYLIASCCHPELFEKLKGFDVRLWHNYDGDTYNELAVKIGGFQVQAGSQVGLSACVLGYALGYRTFEIHGMDCSYRGEARHGGAHPGKAQKRMTVKIGDPITGETFDTSGQMISAAREFINLRLRMPGCKFTVHGTGLLQSMLKYDEQTRKAA